MPSYSFQSSIQSIIQLIINFFEKLFGITRGQPIKTQLPTNINHPLPSNIIKHSNKNIIPTKLPVLPLPIITRHKVNIEKSNKISLPKLPILPLPIITRHKVNIEKSNKISLPKLLILPIKIIPNKSLSQVLNNNSKTNNTSTNTLSTNTSSKNTSTSSTNLSQIAINSNVPLSKNLTQGRTIIASKPNRNPIKNGNNNSQSNNTSKSNSKSIIVNSIEYELYNTIRNSKSSNYIKSNYIKIIKKRWLNGIKISTSCLFIA